MVCLRSSHYGVFGQSRYVITYIQGQGHYSVSKVKVIMVWPCQYI